MPVFRGAGFQRLSRFTWLCDHLSICPMHLLASAMCIEIRVLSLSALCVPSGPSVRNTGVDGVASRCTAAGCAPVPLVDPLRDPWAECADLGYMKWGDCSFQGAIAHFSIGGLMCALSAFMCLTMNFSSLDTKTSAQNQTLELLRVCTALKV